MTPRFSPLAKADLDQIWDYSVENWNESQAESYTRTIFRVTRLLAENPALGRDINGIRAGYFKFPVASHVIFYRKIEKTIEVIRILHKSMDVEKNI